MINDFQVIFKSGENRFIGDILGRTIIEPTYSSPGEGVLETRTSTESRQSEFAGRLKNAIKAKTYSAHTEYLFGRHKYLNARIPCCKHTAN